MRTIEQVLMPYILENAMLIQQNATLLEACKAATEWLTPKISYDMFMDMIKATELKKQLDAAIESST